LISSRKSIAVRLLPSQDLKLALEAICVEHELLAAAIVSAVGSLNGAVLRTGSGAFKQMDGPLEIVSLSGILSTNGIHVHTSVATESGETFGGHLLYGCIINTTVEIVIQNLSDEFVFDRIYDAQTGYKELSIRKTVDS